MQSGKAASEPAAELKSGREASHSSSNFDQSIGFAYQLMSASPTKGTPLRLIWDRSWDMSGQRMAFTLFCGRRTRQLHRLSPPCLRAGQ
jgi:hypothetical protein